MEEPKIIVDNFWCEVYLPYHRCIEFPNQFFAGIIRMLHISSYCLALTTARISVPFKVAISIPCSSWMGIFSAFFKRSENSEFTLSGLLLFLPCDAVDVSPRYDI
ncbi:hypothetical protein ACOSP7_022875 [Xanthoceras sorbifolium]